MENSELYEKTNALFEKCSYAIFLVMPKITPILMVVPIIAASYFMYYTESENGDVFQLPLPMW